MAALSPVLVRRESLVLPTYEPHPPDPYPMFLEKRVYQGSSGRVYPLACTDRIAETPKPRAWDAVTIENEFVRVLLLPELGGRIHQIQDKTNGYDIIYNQPVIKPALVGLAGPWCSGGIEFNWPQHHRPSTFMPADATIEHHQDGSATVWMGEHDPMARMKGMHGVCLHQGRSLVELRARVYNRTQDVQTFLWWANVATRVHEGYQSFFPPDASYVANHARRAMSTFPCSTGTYYGVDYAARGRTGIPPEARPRQFVPPHCGAAPGMDDVPDYRPDDLSWYANIPVPTSYMCMGSSEDFVGGYDHKARAGIIHLANHHISPGKKQWTWGNHDFGYAWDRNLTDADAQGEFAPYIELMAGVYTDNQPDFSYLQPGETKAWSQFWYPIREIGPARHATVEGAVSLQLERRTIHLGVAVTAVHARATINLEINGRKAVTWTQDLSPDRPGLFAHPAARATRADQITVRVLTEDGRPLICSAPPARASVDVPAPATEPLPPAEVASGDELYVFGLHLEQYRHATRIPESYWREALRRDPGDSRCNLALGRWHMRRGEFESAEIHLRASIARLVSRNFNPADGEAYYQLGCCLRHQVFAAPAPDSARLDEAYAAFYKATWNHAWQPAGYHALAEIDCLRGAWLDALDHLDRTLRVGVDNLRARDLKAVVLRQLGRQREAAELLVETLALDPLDWWAVHLTGRTLHCDNNVRLDLAHDCARAGLFDEALAILADPARSVPGRPDGSLGSEPLVHYTRAWITHLRDAWTSGTRRSAVSAPVRKHLAAARRARTDYCFPARLEEIAILRFAMRAGPRDAHAPFFLGHLLYDRRRHAEAIALWETAVRLDPRNAIAWRNLGIAYHNISRDPRRARRAYERAFEADPTNPRLLYERDQLWKRLRVAPRRRLREFQRHRPLVAARDDLSVEFCALSNQIGRPGDALPVVSTRRFQPWEGGEGLALGQHVRTHLALGRAALERSDAATAVREFEQALAVPDNLGESRHLLANPSDIHYWLGCALEAVNDREAARRHWITAAEFRGDFQGMRVHTYSEMSYFSALALEKLGRAADARRLLRGLLAYVRRLARTPATIDYFATSLPTMLLFDDDLAARQVTNARLLEAQALLGLGRPAAARARLREVLRRDPSHALAADLLSVSTSQR